MAFITTTFKLDLTPGASRQVLYASQGDIGRPFKAELYWNGTRFNADACTAVLRGKKVDATVFEYDTPVIDGYYCTFETAEQMTIISGPVECELVFSNDGDIIASANFVLIVEASPYDPNAISESEVQGLNAMIQAATPEAVDDWFETEAPTSETFTNAVSDAVSDYIDEHGMALAMDTNGYVRLGGATNGN